MTRLTFSGHETFHCRHFWLKKGYDFLQDEHSFSDVSAVVDLGVGRNMVSAIKFWLKAFDVSNEKDRVTQLGDFLFGPDGKDLYLEDTASLWLLHYNLVSHARASIYSLIFNDFRKERVEFNKEHLLWFLKRKCQEQNSAYNSTTMSNDINVFIKSYLRPQQKTKSSEDDFSGLLLELELVQLLDRFEGGTTPWYKIESRERADLPVEIVLFSLLDNENYGASVSFNQLLNGHNSIGMVYAMNASGLMEKIESLTSKHDFITFSDNAGIRELQFRERPNKWDMLSEYYNAT